MYTNNTLFEKEIKKKDLIYDRIKKNKVLKIKLRDVKDTLKIIKHWWKKAHASGKTLDVHTLEELATQMSILLTFHKISTQIQQHVSQK